MSCVATQAHILLGYALAFILRVRDYQSFVKFRKALLRPRP